MKFAVISVHFVLVVVADFLPATVHHHIAQAFAMGTGALGRVERKIVGRRIAIRNAAGGTHETARVVMHIARIGIAHHHGTAALLHRSANAAQQPHMILRRIILKRCGRGYLEPVHHHFDIVVAVAVKLHAGKQLFNFAVNTGIEIALTAETLKELPIVALSVFHHRRHDVQLVSAVALENQVENLLLAVVHHLLSGNVGKGFSGTGVKQAEEVVDFGRRADGRARIFVRRLLLDTDHGRQAGNLIHVGTREIAQKIAGISRKGLDVAALPFSIYGVKRQ